MSFKFFINKSCEYYPCHNLNEVDNEFNCLFCFCPMYFIECLGDPKYLANGIRDCSSCVYPHQKDNYNSIIAIITNETKNRLKQ